MLDDFPVLEAEDVEADFGAEEVVFSVREHEWPILEHAHMVDFVQAPLAVGSVIFVRAGQVQQWRLSPGLDGSLVLLTAEALQPSAGYLSARQAKGPTWDEWPAAS